MERVQTGSCVNPYARIHELMQQGSVVEGIYRDEFTDVTDVQTAGLSHRDGARL